jgi:hypothetical protein
LWIENHLIPYLIGGNAQEGDGQASIQASRSGLGPPRAGRTDRVRAMFLTWLTLVAIGLVTYSIVGISHH